MYYEMKLNETHHCAMFTMIIRIMNVAQLEKICIIEKFRFSVQPDDSSSCDGRKHDIGNGRGFFAASD